VLLQLSQLIISQCSSPWYVMLRVLPRTLLLPGVLLLLLLLLPQVQAYVATRLCRCIQWLQQQHCLWGKLCHQQQVGQGKLVLQAVIKAMENILSGTRTTAVHSTRVSV
jgi:hypothetical protein